MGKYDDIQANPERPTIPLDLEPQLIYKPTYLNKHSTKNVEQDDDARSFKQQKPTPEEEEKMTDFTLVKKELPDNKNSKKISSATNLVSEVKKKTEPSPAKPPGGKVPSKIKIELPTPFHFKTDDLGKYLKNIKVIEPIAEALEEPTKITKKNSPPILNIESFAKAEPPQPKPIEKPKQVKVIQPVQLPVESAPVSKEEVFHDKIQEAINAELKVANSSIESLSTALHSTPPAENLSQVLEPAQTVPTSEITLKPTPIIAPKKVLPKPQLIEKNRFQNTSALLLNNKSVKQYLNLGGLNNKKNIYESPIRSRVRLAMKVVGFGLLVFGIYEFSKGFLQGQGFSANRMFEFFTFIFVSFVLIYFAENFDLIIRPDDDPFKLKNKASDNPFDPVFPA